MTASMADRPCNLVTSLIIRHPAHSTNDLKKKKRKNIMHKEMKQQTIDTLMNTTASGPERDGV